MSMLVWAPPSQHVAVHKNPPDVLLAAMQPRTLEKWRKANTWADNIDMIVFTDHDAPAALRSMVTCVAFADMTGMSPHMCINVPSGAIGALHDIKAMPSGANALVDSALRYGSAVAAVGRALRGLKCAWIQPESDHSHGALQIAKANRICTAYSQTEMIDSIGMRASTVLGVDVQTLGKISTQQVEN